MQYYSTTQVAKILGISRIAVFKNIKSGKIRAQKVGRNYIINVDDLIEDIMRDSLPTSATGEEKKKMRTQVEKLISNKV